MNSPSSPITVDLEKAKAAYAALKANPPSHSDIVSDPQAFLASLGVQVDGTTLSTIQTKLAASPGLAKGAQQAAIVHIDTGL